MRADDFIKRLFDMARAAGFSDYEAYLASGDSFEASVHAGQLIAYNVSSTRGLGFRALIGGRMGYASTQALDEDAAGMLIDGARASALLTESADPQRLFEGGEIPALDLYNPALDEITGAQKVRMALELEKKALAVDGRIATDGCAVLYAAGSRRIVNSKGLDVAFRDNAMGAYVSTVAREGGRADAPLGTVLEVAEREVAPGSGGRFREVGPHPGRALAHPDRPSLGGRRSPCGYGTRGAHAGGIGSALGQPGLLPPAHGAQPGR